MFDYIDKKIKEADTISEVEHHVTAFDICDFFTNEHYQKIAHDIEDFKKLYTHSDAPPQGTEPSIIIFDEIANKDSFYKELWNYTKTNDFKKQILKKFNFDNIDQVAELTSSRISFHTEYEHQIDKAHTDQKNSLSTITLQIYLPKDNNLEQYGTQFVDNADNEMYRKKFLPNQGYIMISNNNSWHKPTLGVERNSLVIRLTVNLDYAETKTVYNYNSDNDVCYAVWNKDMHVLPKQTDWMATMTILNMIDHGFENIAVTTQPFKGDLKFLKGLKKKGFKKVLVAFGGYVWTDNSIIDYVNNLDMTTPIAGWKTGSEKELVRQCFIINLDMLDSIKEDFAYNKFFAECIDNYTDIRYEICDHRHYYHPETEDADNIVGWISRKIPYDDEQLSKKIGYFSPYMKNHNTLQSLTKSMSA
tara:strand:- start:1858 stop:3108 length:1251 start_codon:yes stop_codon:yes gene_type:complete